MDDSDTILTIYPPSGLGRSNAIDSINRNADRPGYVQGKQVEQVASYGSADIAPSRPTTPEGRTLDDDPSYRVTFSSGTKTRMGFVVGSHPQCDFVVVSDGSVSAYHLAFQFDEEYRLVVKDLSSTRGTFVAYGEDKAAYGENKAGLRVGTGCILGGCRFTDDKAIVVNLADYSQLLIKIPRRDISSPEYRNKVDRFRQGTNASPEALLVRDLQIKSRVATAQPSNAATPLKERDMKILVSHLGQGNFATVSHYWNAETGKEFVEKTPRNLDDYARRVWEEEANILRQIRHKHIVELFDAKSDPPVLILEYVAKGSLADYLARSERFSIFETGEVLRQITDVLQYLDGQNIVHRDLSPHNILVSQRDPDGIIIKLADFGLSKKAMDFTTFCGHSFYVAPEIVRWRSSGSSSVPTYKSAVDIWSAGVVVAELICGLPARPARELAHPSTTWHEDICDHVRDYHRRTRERLATFLLGNMLVIDPADRAPAAECHERAMREKAMSEEAMGESENTRWGEIGFMETRPGANDGGEGTFSSLSVDHYIQNFLSFDARSTPTQSTVASQAAEPVRRDPSGVQSFINKARDPFSSFFMGSAVSGIDGNFDIRYGTAMQSIMSFAANIAGQNEPPAGPPPSPLAVVWPSPATTPTAATPTAATPIITSPTVAEVFPPEYMVLAASSDPTRLVSSPEPSLMCDEMETEPGQEAQSGGQKRTRTQETDNVGNGPIRKLRRSATSGPEDEPLSKRSRWVDDEDSEELVGLEKWIADGGEA